VGDAPVLQELLDPFPPEQETASVTADGAFDTRTSHDAAAARGAAAIIPHRRNARPWKPDTPGDLEARRPDHLATMERKPPPEPHRDADALREPAGRRLSARDFDRQAAEFQIRVAVLNGFTALGTPVTEVAGLGCPGKGGVRPSHDSCSRASWIPSQIPA